MDPKIDLLFEALDDLIRPAVEGRKPTDVDQVLERNLNSALEKLQIKDINSLPTLKSINCYTLPKCSIRWRFVCALMHILVSLKKCLSASSVLVPPSTLNSTISSSTSNSIPSPTNLSSSTSISIPTSTPTVNATIPTTIPSSTPTSNTTPPSSTSTSYNSSTSSPLAVGSSTTSSLLSLTSSSCCSSSSSTENQTPQQSIVTASRERTLRACLQFVVSIGLLPNLLPGVGVSLSSRCSAASAPITREDKLLDLEKHERLSGVTRGLMVMCDQPILRNLIISNHLGDVLAALAQLSFVPFKRPTNPLPTGSEDDPSSNSNSTGDGFVMTPAILAHLEKERAKFKSYFVSLVAVTYQPLMIRELMLLQGQPVGGNKGQRAHPAPKWLKRPCTHMLMQCMCRPNGIESLIRVIMDAAPDTVNQPAKMDIIVQLVTIPPASTEANNYLESVATQIVDLIRRRDPLMTRVAVLCVEALLESRREFCTRRILKVLLQPLLKCTAINNINTFEFESLFLPEPDTPSSPLPSSNEIAACIRTLHNAWISHTAVLNGQLLRPALFVLFRLACALTDTGSPLKEHVHDLVYKHLQHCTKEELPAVYCALLFREPLPGALDVLPNLNFSVNETTGDLILEEKIEEREETAEWLHWSQIAGDSLVSILLQRDPSGELVNVLFVCLLSKATLHQVNKYSIVGAKLLTVLAAIPYVQECIGTDPIPVIKFIQTWLEREANLMATSKQAEFQDWECLITVLMILTVIINYSGADSSSSSPSGDTDWDAFQVLLEPLQRIQKLATSEEIKTFTSDVFNALVTHGAVRKDLLSPTNTSSAASAKSTSSTSTSTSPTSSTTTTTSATPPTTKGRRKKAKPRKKEEKMNATGGESNANDAKAKEEKKEKKTENDKKKIDLLSEASAASILELHNADLNKLLESSAAAAAASGKGGGEETSTASSANVIEALVDACSEEIPVRGHGLIALTRLLSNMDSSVKPHIKKILTIMHENIRHPDSYVYLAAIRGMVALSAFEKEQVIKILIEEYTNSVPRTDMPASEAIEHRLKIGEVLVLLMRMHGETIMKYKNLLLNAFLIGTKDPVYQIRTSSLSELAEVCKELRYNVGPVINEIMVCITSLLRSDPVIEVRRAAVMVFTIMLRGLGKDMHKVLADQLSQIYSTLKHVYQHETDEKLRLHAQMALEEVAEFAVHFMFPKPTKEKHIYVRSAPPADF